MTTLAGLLGVILAAGWASTYAWRFIGVYLAERAAPDSEILLWVRAVATALVAALVTRIILVPPGQLGVTSLEARVVAMAVGVAVFYIARRSTGAGVAAALCALFAAAWGIML